MNTVVEFVLAPNSSVTCSFHQNSKEQAVQFLNVRAQLQEGSRLDLTGITTGGSMTRNDIHVDLDGAEAFCSLAGLSILEQRSQAFQHVTVNHRYLNCTSRQVYKNILAGESVAEFNSMVHVWRCAKKSDSEQLDKNLLLSDTARVYSRPQLKIDNDDVRASHGAATGQMEKEELFYLQSRGIPKDQARYLLIYGFAQEVLQKVQPETVRKDWTAQTEKQILKVAGMGS
jgi:Fe-S cluster assembly protein SufD